MICKIGEESEAIYEEIYDSVDNLQNPMANNETVGDVMHLHQALKQPD